MTAIRLTAAINLLAAVSGKPRRFSIRAYSGGTLPVEGFPLPVVVDLAGLTSPDSIPILVDHANSIETTIGQTDSIENNGRESLLAGSITVDPPREGVPLTPAQQVIARSNHKWRASIGVLVQEQQPIPAGQTVHVNGQSFVGPVIVARRSQFGETSVLAMGADSTTQVNLAAKAATMPQGNIMGTFEEWIAGLGITLTNLSDTDKAALLMAYDAVQNPLTPPAPVATDPAAATTTAAALVNLRAAANHQRIADIERLTVGYPHIASTAIVRGWSIPETEIAVLKASQRQTAPPPPSHSHAYGGNVATGPQHLTASLMVKAGYSAAAEKMFGERVMHESRRLHGNSLPDLCRAALLLDGREVPNDRGQMIRAALSTGSMPVALGDSANKILIEAYRTAPASWRSFAAIKPAANFKTQSGIRPTFGGDLSQLPPGGEIHHGSYNEEVYEWHVDTFAKIFKIDRRDFINDDASVFSDVIPGLARASMRTLNSLVATTLLANASSFFGTAHLNYFEGAATNLQASSLATAIKMLRQMKDGEGNLLDLEPAVLLVPPELEQLALALLNSTEVARVATGDQLPTGNTFKDIAQLAVEPRMSDSAFTGYSAVAWYLFSNAMNASVVVGFLDGAEQPTLETFGLDADIDTLAYGFRVYHDFGCALADFRAAIRSKGAA